MVTNNSLNQRSEALALGTIGTVTPDATNYLLKLDKSQNGQTGIRITNTNTGASSASTIVFDSDTCAASISAFSSNTPTLANTFFVNVTGGDTAFQIDANTQFVVTKTGASLDMFYIDAATGNTVFNAPGNNQGQCAWAGSHSVVWIAGLDTSDSNTWKLCSGSTFGTGTTIRALTTGGQYKGNNTNTAPPAGFIGEVIRSAVAFTSPISLPTGTATNITSISVTAGIWDITGIVSFNAAAITGTAFQASISPTSATLANAYGDGTIQTPYPPTSVTSNSLTIPAYRVTLSATTTYYLVAAGTYTVGTLTGFGRISAVRVG